MHILDLAQNSITAGANLVEITIKEDIEEDTLIITIDDNGRGMDKELLERVKDPFVTTRTTRMVGLGIPLMAAACSRCEGELIIESEKNVGTKLMAKLKHSHIDRAPMGNIADTIVSLILIGSGEETTVNFVYRHILNSREFSLDTRELRNILGKDVSLSVPEVLTWIKDYINEGLANLRGGV